MDRDKRWDRIKEAYDLMVHGSGEKTSDILSSINQSYNNGITDEFIKPIVIVDEHNNAISTIKSGDTVICFNFRTDRCRQITDVLTQTSMPEFEMNSLELHYTTMTNYDDTFNVNVIYEKENIKNTLGEILEKNNKSQICHTLQSIINQKFKKIELIVIDGYSDDGTEIIVKKYFKQSN